MIVQGFQLTAHGPVPALQAFSTGTLHRSILVKLLKLCYKNVILSKMYQSFFEKLWPTMSKCKKKMVGDPWDRLEF